MSTTIPMPKLLTPDERVKLEKCEKTIEQGLETFYDVGMNLLAIRDGRLYRETHSTFAIYCEERWNFTDRRARQVMEAAQVVTLLKVEAEKSGTIVPIPKNEAQARELAKVDPEKRSEVLNKAIIQSGGEPSAKDIQQAADSTRIISKGLTRLSSQKSLDSITGAIGKFEEAFPDEIPVLIADLELHLDRLKQTINQKAA